ncbi:MAG: phenazine biosynthesis protein PhzF [Clostridiales bacterium GWB2_37_7]|nr:MAG: phenazine biosynthesis protein PhzF [Clostridiales bacterium GWB2_37_7]
MNVKAYKLNSFTQNIEGGNPAGVVLHAEELNEAQMQKLAELIGFSETAFVTKSETADFRIRFFTPCAEVDLCGHATIAVFNLLHQRGFLQEGEYTQETKAGILKIRIQNNTVFMQQAMPQYYEIVEGEELADCLEIDINALEDKLPIQAVSTGLKDILVPLKNEEYLANLKPNMKKIEELSKKYNAVGLHVFAISNADKKTICRNFAPLYGIPEESATGTSNGALACYLHKYGVITENNKEIIFEQGIYMHKPSIIKAKLDVQNNALVEIWIGGDAVLLEEELYII